VANPFLSIFMLRGREKEQQKNGKSVVLLSGVWGFHNKHRGMPMMTSIALILGYYLVLIMRNDEWNELTRHLKDRGKNRLNLRINSLQPGENDVDCRRFYYCARSCDRAPICARARLSTHGIIMLIIAFLLSLNDIMLLFY
jgi:hypothetical protein